MANRYLHRFGASWANCEGQLLLVGGIISHTVTPERGEIVVLDFENEIGQPKAKLTDVERHSKRPLLIGHSITTSGKSLIIMGGGAVCFSFGTFWNRGCYTVLLEEEAVNNLPALGKELAASLEPWEYLDTINIELSSVSEMSTYLPVGYERPREPVSI